MIARDAAVLEDDLTRVRRATSELVELAQHLEATRSFGHDEHALPAVSRLRIHRRHHDVHICNSAAADEDLLSVDDPVAAVTARAPLDRATGATAAWPTA